MEGLNAELLQLDRQETWRHVLLCSACRKQALTLQLPAAEETWEAGPAVFSGKVLRRAVKILKERYSRSLAEEEAAGPLCEELLALTAAEQRERLLSDPRYASAAVARRLLNSALACRPRNLRRISRLARLAIEVGQLLPAPEGLERAAILGRAHVWWGEAERDLGNYSFAIAAFQRATPDLETLPLLSPERAEYCRLLARLRHELRRHDEALALLARAVDLYRELGEPQRAAECQIELGGMLYSELEAEAALPFFAEAAALFQDPGDFRAWLAARSGLAHCYADLGFREEARTIGAELQRESAGCAEEDRFRARRAAEDIEKALGDDGRAMAIHAKERQLARAESEALEAR
jgi:tetratricopeptide (TPR) repeat protein